MPNGDGHKDFGGHKYATDGTSNCEHGCGCWMGSSHSGGPVGLDPLGQCPGNPLDGKKREGNIDYGDVVEQRIKSLETRALKAERALKVVSPDKKKLVKTIEKLKLKLFRSESVLADVRDSLKRKW